MEKYRLSFAYINILFGNIAEVVIDNSVTVSLEMVEELDKFLTNSFDSQYALLINKLNDYNFSFEAMFSVASHENIQAIAVINYSKEGEIMTLDIIEQRKIDQLNIKMFSGLDLGYQQSINWLKNQLIMA